MVTGDKNFLLKTADVQRRFDRAAVQFDDVDFVHTVTRNGMLDRLEPMRVAADVIVDLGCATGSAYRRLARRFQRPRVIGIDLSLGMLEGLERNRPRFAKLSALQADAMQLPLADQSVDVVFANLLLPWINDPLELFSELARVLKKDGLLLFSTLGPDSLREVRDAWTVADTNAHVHRFLDMHDIGDAAVRGGLRDPVLDVERLAVTYTSTTALFRDLTAVGGRNCLQQRARSLAGKQRFMTMTSALERGMTEGLIRLDLELVYGHCWGSGPPRSGTEFRVDATQIGRRA